MRVEAFERADGDWDLEACLTDEKPRDVHLASGVRPQGLPIHELWLRVTIDRNFEILDAEASSIWAPYGERCAASNPEYHRLIGLNLVRNFRRESARLLGGTTGCTHLTELCAVLPTAAIQAFAGEVWNTEKGGAPGPDSPVINDKPPFQLGRCNALRFDGDAVREFYPQWFGYEPGRVADEQVSGENAASERTEIAD